MKWWTKILPFFFIEWYAKKHVEWLTDQDGNYVYPYEHVKIYTKYHWEE